MVFEFNSLDNLGKSFVCKYCGKTHSILMKAVVIGDNVFSKLCAVGQNLGLEKRLLVVVDNNTDIVAGKKICIELGEKGFVVKKVCLGKEKGLVVADENSALEVSSQLNDVDWLLAVGTGTINDIVKYVAKNNALPYVTFFTAASINGISSNRAVIDIGGVKKSFSVDAPIALFCDLGVVKNAPKGMNSSGFGDLFSYPVSLSDWKLDSIINNAYFCPLPQAIANVYGKKCIAKASGVPRGDKGSLTVLVSSLVAVGLSVTLTNTSAPVSGAEHLMSYLWDLKNEMQSRPFQSHGFQIAIATLLAAKLYEKILSLNPKDFDAKAICARRESLQEIEALFLKKFGNAGKEMVEIYKKKTFSEEQLNKKISVITANWKKIQSLKENLLSAKDLQKILLKAGAFVPLKELGLDKESLVDAVLFSAFVRERYTILDLALELGVLNKKSAEEIIDECAFL